VTQAYLGAALAEESAEIVAASVALAQAHLDQVTLQHSAGTASELDVLRAEVELENLRPQLAAAANARDLAASNLKRLVNLPASSELVLTTPLTAPAGAPGAAELPTLDAAQPVLAQRAAVRAAEAQVAMREEQVDIARAAFLPNVALQGNFSRQAFPSGMFPSGGDWRDDWNVGLAVSWPLFQGLRRRADVDAAQAQVQQATLQLAQLEESVRLEYDTALRELERARLQIAAAGRTVAQAQRVYDLTELRYREGLATQLDVSSARLALQQARLNEATAYHDYYLARARAERALGRSLAAASNR
jgi:HAE1 family hydrophobic/amphiphilic exporter-1